MRRLSALLPILVLLAGCGQTTASSTEAFEGEERAVAQVVEDLQAAGERRAADDICGEILDRELVDRLREAGSTCVAEMERAIEDADDFELQVRDVTVTGQTARATVERREGGEQGTAVFEFQLVQGVWRASSLAGRPS